MQKSKPSYKKTFRPKKSGRTAYKGRYKPKNLNKYDGDFTDIVYRSSWERQFMRWCDHNNNVTKWGSETVIVPYICATDKRAHRYYPDFIVTFKSGKTIMVEVKPDAQTKPPKERSRKTKKYKEEVLTYVKNQSKWKAARKFCESRGWEFQIMTEHNLRKLGLKLL